jgi:hypothetical protein
MHQRRRAKKAFEPIIVKAHAQAMNDEVGGHRIEQLLEREPADLIPDYGCRSFKHCGVTSCSATRHMLTPSSIGSFITLIASNSLARA